MNDRLNIIKQWFRDRGISQVHISKQTGMSPAYISQLFKGTYVFSMSSARKFHDAFGFSIRWIIDGEGEMMDENFTATPSASVAAVPSTPQSVSQETFEQILQKKDEQIEKMQQQIDSLISVISKMKE